MRRLGVAMLSLAAVLLTPVRAEGVETRHTYTNTAGTREYLLYTPAHAGPMPLVVYLHGCGAPPSVPGLNEMAEQRGFAVAYPIQPSQANASGCWNWYVDQHPAIVDFLLSHPMRLDC